MKHSIYSRDVSTLYSSQFQLIQIESILIDIIIRFYLNKIENELSIKSTLE